MWSASIKRTALFILLTGILGTASFVNAGTIATAALPVEKQVENTVGKTVEDPVIIPRDVALILPMAVAPNPLGLLTDSELAPFVAADGPLHQILTLAETHNLTVGIDPYLLNSLAQSSLTDSADLLTRILNSSAHKFLQSYAGVPLSELISAKQFDTFLYGSVDDLILQNPEKLSTLLTAVMPIISNPDSTFDQKGLDVLEKKIAKQLTTLLLSDRQIKQSSSIKSDNYRAKILLPETTLLFSAEKPSDLASKFLASGNRVELNQLSADLQHSAALQQSSQLQQDVQESPQQIIIAPQYALRSESVDGEVAPVVTAAPFQELVTMFEGSELFRLIPITSLIADEATSKHLSDVLDPVQRSENKALTDVIKKQDRVATFLEALTNPGPATAQYRLFMAQALGNNLDETMRVEAIIDYMESADNVLGSITLDPGSDITMITEKSSFWVSVNNDLVSEASVVVKINSNNNRLVHPSSLPVTVAGQSRETVTIPVTSLSNGTVELTISLYSESGVKIGPTQKLTITIRAEIEQITVIIFIVLVTGFLGAGIVRSILKRKRLLGAIPETPEVEHK